MPINQDDFGRSRRPYVQGLERVLTDEDIFKIHGIQNVQNKPAEEEKKLTPIEAKNIIVGIDLGKEVDRTVIVVIQPTGEYEKPIYQIHRIIPVALGTSYPDIIRGLVELDKHLRELNAKEISYVIDAGGAAGVVDALEEELPMADVYRVHLTAGLNVNMTGMKISLPKREMVTTLARVLDEHRIDVVSTRDEGVVLLESELNNYQMKIMDSGYDKYEAGTGHHDDAVCALAEGLWFSEHEAAMGQARLF
jgi:hypothetical protein